jgi:hypothetical protein
MAQREHQLEPLVRQRVRADMQGSDPFAFGAPAVDGAAARRERDPGRGVGRDAVARPALERDDVRVLDRLLGAVEVPERSRQGGDGLPRLATEQPVDRDSGAAQSPIAS